MKCSVIIMAAGKGSRMKSDTPKVLHKICGKEMLYYSTKEACAISDLAFLCSTGYIGVPSWEANIDQMV